MKRYNGAIFDMDGVLFDTERVFQQTWKELARERGVALADGFMETICGTNGAKMCRLIEQFYHVPDGAEIVNECKRRVAEKLSKSVPEKPGAREIIEYFRAAGVRTAVASSSSRRQILSNLTLSGLLPLIDVVISGDEVTACKPDPEIFLRAAAALGCDPADCCVFEDSLGGVRAGHAAGCDTVMVPDLIPPTPEIMPLCFRIYDSLNDALSEIRSVR